MDKQEQKSLTELRLEQALERLLEGKPEKTKQDGKINLKRINDEAGLSSGGLYYYKEFEAKARASIDERNASTKKKHYSVDKNQITRLRAERDKQKALKVRYKEQREDIQIFADGVVHENAKLHFSLYEAMMRIERLESEIVAIKVTKITGKNK